MIRETSSAILARIQMNYGNSGISLDRNKVTITGTEGVWPGADNGNVLGGQPLAVSGYVAPQASWYGNSAHISQLHQSGPSQYGAVVEERWSQWDETEVIYASKITWGVQWL
jgi:hypothetical protein